MVCGGLGDVQMNSSVTRVIFGGMVMGVCIFVFSNFYLFSGFSPREGCLLGSVLRGLANNIEQSVLSIFNNNNNISVRNS